MANMELRMKGFDIIEWDTYKGAEGEIYLIYAVLERALKDTKSKDRTIRLPAINWVKHSKEFPEYCEYLDINPGRLRSLLGLDDDSGRHTNKL